MIRLVLVVALLALSGLVSPAAAQSAQRVCTPLIHVIGPARIGERRAMESARADFETRLRNQFGQPHPYSMDRALRDGTLQSSCRRDGARQSCSFTGTLCVLSRAVPTCSEPQRIDVNGLEDTCRQPPAPIPQGSGPFAPSIGGGASFVGPIPCPHGYQRRVLAGADQCVLPGY